MINLSQMVIVLGCIHLQEYGGLENAPDEIKATVVEMEQLTMSEVS